MGIVRHNSIIITGDIVAERSLILDKVYIKAKELFNDLVTPIITTRLNGYYSFFIAPDGSNDNHSYSEVYDKMRDELYNYINSFAYQDGSNSIKYIDVSYGELEFEFNAIISKTNVNNYSSS